MHFHFPVAPMTAYLLTFIFIAQQTHSHYPKLTENGSIAVYQWLGCPHGQRYHGPTKYACLSGRKEPRSSGLEKAKLLLGEDRRLLYHWLYGREVGLRWQIALLVDGAVVEVVPVSALRLHHVREGVRWHGDVTELDHVVVGVGVGVV